VRVLNELYEPTAFFDRLEDLFLRQKLRPSAGRERYWRAHRWQRFKSKAGIWLRSAGLYARLMWRVPDATLRAEYRRRIGRLLRAQPGPDLLFNYVVKCAIHFHHYTMARQMATGAGAVYNSF
jgi:hypothetical protein